MQLEDRPNASFEVAAVALRQIPDPCAVGHHDRWIAAALVRVAQLRPELADLRHLRPDWADRVEAAAIAPDMQEAAE